MATVTNLTNTTWVFNLSKLNFQHWVLKKINIVFISNSTTYSAMSCTIHAYESSIGKYCDSLYYETPNISSLAYRCEYVGNSYDVDRYTLKVNNVPLTIIDGDVFNSSLIKFLSYNATCQTTLVTVTFNMNGKGTAVDSQVFASGEKVIMPIITPDENYIFAGWYIDSSLTTAFDFSTSVTSDITLYAKWIPKAIKTKVSGAWNSGTPLVKVNNAWKDVDKAFVKVDGVWQPVINNEHPSIVKCAEFSTASNSNFNSSSFHISRGYLSFKILTNDPFLFNIDVEFSGATFAWYTVGIHSSTTPSVVSNYNYFTIDNPILDDIEISYTGAISIPGGNINKYIVIYFDKDSGDGGLSGTFKFLSNYYSGNIYMSSDSIYKPFTFCEKTFWFIDGMTWQDWLNSTLDTSTHGMVLDPPYDETVEGGGRRTLTYLDSFVVSNDSGNSLVCYGDRYWNAIYTGDRDTYIDLVIALNTPKGQHNVAPTDKIISTTYVEGTSFNYY